MEIVKLSDNLKDYQIAQQMFGMTKEKKQECAIIKQLRKHGTVESLCDGYSIIKNKQLPEDMGWIISNELLK